MRVAIIGAGAAGCFVAVNLKRQCPTAEVTVYESGRKPLAKVAVTGGGRCNLTNSFESVRSLAAVYPRGERLMKRLMKEFGHKDACRWFESEGVRLVTQPDCCVFPQSQDAMEIVGTLTCLMRRHDVILKTGYRVTLIEHRKDSGMASGDEVAQPYNKAAECSDDAGRPSEYIISFADETQPKSVADIVVVTTGGCQKIAGMDMLRRLDIGTVAPVPSLFSLCLPEDAVTAMTGTVVENVTASLAGTRLRASGPLLITHWGMSGPAILKLSSYGARILAECGYKAMLNINWLGEAGEAEATEMLVGYTVRHPQKQLSSIYPQQLNARIWQHLLEHSALNPSMRWGELGRKGMNRLVNTLTNSQHRVDGKNRFKEEFVTCGGVALSEIDPHTLESRKHDGR